jgi:hypothetical protein
MTSPVSPSAPAIVIAPAGIQVAPPAAPEVQATPTPSGATPAAPAAPGSVDNVNPQFAFPGTSDTRTVEQVDQEIKAANAGLNKPFSVDERVPANWSILPEEDGIRAFNNVTLRVFIGSIQEFNARLKE